MKPIEHTQIKTYRPCRICHAYVVNITGTEYPWVLVGSAFRNVTIGCKVTCLFTYLTAKTLDTCIIQARTQTNTHTSNQHSCSINHYDTNESFDSFLAGSVLRHLTNGHQLTLVGSHENATNKDKRIIILFSYCDGRFSLHPPHAR